MSDLSFYVEIRPWEGDEADEGYRLMGPFTARQAERVDRGANINLDHDRYVTAVVQYDDLTKAQLARLFS